MSRHILWGLALALLVLTNSSSATELTDNTALGISPLRSDLAFQFYNLGSQYLTGAQKIIPNVSEKCSIDIIRIAEGVKKIEEWALEFPDSWGRAPMGLMWGHTSSFGQYEECIAATRTYYLSDDKEETVDGQYCLAKVPIHKFMEDMVKRNETTGTMKISYKYSLPKIFELGVCVPKTCTVDDTNEILKQVLRAYIPDKYDINDNTKMIEEGRCDYKKPVELRGIDIFAICFFAIIIFIMLVSSIYDYVQTEKKQPKKPLFIAFSVLTNAPKIFTVKRVNNPNVIHCLNGLRVFSMMWVVFGHGYMTFMELPHINKDKIYTWYETPYSMLVQNATLCVDTFFFMSGLLMLWGAFREMERTKGKLDIKMMYFHRYIRLTPVLAVVILYIMSLYKYSGAGPMWMKIGTQDKRCEDSWWASLLYVQNYAYPYHICVSQSWYLAVDTQLYVLSPLFLIPLWKWGKKAVIPIGIFWVLCMGCTFATFMVNDFTLFRIRDDHVDMRQAKTYYPTHTRIPTWLIGMLFGYFLYTKNRGKQIPLGKGWVLFGWISSFIIMLACLWGPYWRILPSTPESPIIEGAFYEPFSRTAWALCIGWIVWACYNGHGGIINDFLSWGFFTGFSRLCYCMYVIHRIVQLVNGGRIQHDTHFGDYDMILRWWHDFGIALTASIFATLAFEAPILGIEKAIFGRGDVKPAPKKIEPTSAAPAVETPVTTAAVIETPVPEGPAKV